MSEELKKIVSLKKCSSYQSEALKQALDELLLPLGNWKGFVKPGETILLKINLLGPYPPERAVTTHPELVRAVARKVKEAGGKPIIADSPGGRDNQRRIGKILKTTGIEEVCESENVDFILLDQKVEKVKVTEIANPCYPYLEIGKEILEVDGIISLPKLKTHGFMKLTGAVKVLFGCIPGIKKAEYHLRVAERIDFAKLLIEILLKVKPRLSIMDGIIAMEGEGPSSGEPYPLNLLLASSDSVALDVIAAYVIGFNPEEVYTNAVAKELGFWKSLKEIEVTGEKLEEIKTTDFKLPQKDLFDSIPPALRHFLRNLTTAKPVLGYPERCTACLTCKENCPSKAITMKNNKPVFDYQKCIRCYCCHELCPEKALSLAYPFLSRIFGQH